jgi:hypothetical protein
MALYNVDNSNGYLQALSNDAYAISEPITQDTGENDFKSVENIRCFYDLINISSADTSDVLKLGFQPNDGDEMLLVKSDDSIHTLTINSNLYLGIEQAISVPLMTSNTAPSGVASSSTVMNNSSNFAPFNAFDRQALDHGWAPDGGDYFSTIGYQYDSGMKVKNTKYRINMGNMDSVTNQPGSDYAASQWVLQGSNDGSIWDDLDARTGEGQNIWDAKNAGGVIYTIASPGEYNYYRLTDIRRYKDDGAAISGLTNFDLLSDMYKYDTTAITGGEIPDKAFINRETLEINSMLVPIKTKSYGYNTAYNGYLRGRIDFMNTAVTGREIINTINFSKAGNKLTEMTFDIYRVG